jgi:hypothetical protein
MTFSCIATRELYTVSKIRLESLLIFKKHFTFTNCEKAFRVFEMQTKNKNFSYATSGSIAK